MVNGPNRRRQLPPQKIQALRPRCVAKGGRLGHHSGMSSHGSSNADADQRVLAAAGYRQELDRTLGRFSSFAAGFSYISILTGMFQNFHLGFSAGGPAFFWTWPLMFAGQLMVAL